MDDRKLQARMVSGARVATSSWMNMRVAVDEYRWSTTRPAYIRNGCLRARAAASPAGGRLCACTGSRASTIYACARAIMRQLLARSLVIKHPRAPWRRGQGTKEIN
jgi:hypothetical protein